MELLYERSNAARQKTKETIDNKIEDDRIGRREVTQEQKSVNENPLDENQVEENLVVLLEQRLQFLLRSLTKLFLSKSPVHNKKEYVTLKFIRFFKN